MIIFSIAANSLTFANTFFHNFVTDERTYEKKVKIYGFPTVLRYNYIITVLFYRKCFRKNTYRAVPNSY